MNFNGKDLLATVGSGISICKEIPPFMIGRNLTTLAGAKRVYLGTAGIASQTYTLKLNIYGGTMANAWAMRQKIAEWAYSEAEAPLIPTHQPSIYYNAILQEISNPTFVFGACTVDVVFLIPTPFAYAVTKVYKTGTDSIAFTNNGTAEPMIKLTLVPSASVLPTVYVNSGMVFRATANVGENVPAVIDFEKRTYMVNQLYANDKINFLLTDWQPGWRKGNNIVTCSNTTLTAEIVQRWI